MPWWTLVPRRWHSTLFEHNAGEPTHTVCSSLIASAFQSVDFPILPLIQKDEAGNYRLFRRNPKLYVPRDFDYSPFFEVIKCPLLASHKSFFRRTRTGYYRKFDWADTPEPEDDQELHRLSTTHDIIHVSAELARQNLGEEEESGEGRAQKANQPRGNE